MVYDPDLLDQLEAMPKETFDGEVFRATRQNLDPLAGSYNGGRWMRRDAAAIIYTSLVREGALAEIVFHFSQLNPRPTKAVKVHRLNVVAHRTLRVIRTDLAALGVAYAEYQGVNMPRTQEIGAAAEFLGCDGLIAPSARWPCDNLMLFPDRAGIDASLELIHSETIEWIAWGRENKLLD